MTKVEPATYMQSGYDNFEHADIREVEIDEIDIDEDHNPSSWTDIICPQSSQQQQQQRQQLQPQPEISFYPQAQITLVHRKITIVPREQHLVQHQLQHQVAEEPSHSQKRPHQEQQQPQQLSRQQPQEQQQQQQQSPDRKKRRKGKLLLWQFLLQDLLDGHSNLSWLDDQKANPGVFAFRDPNQAARRWGTYKENDNMSYEKMSRCIRDYWIRSDNRYHQVMVPDPTKGRRLHFAYNLAHREVQQFVRNSSSEYFQHLVDQGVVKSQLQG